LIIVGVAVRLITCGHAALVPRPGKDDLRRLVGDQIGDVKVLNWAAGDLEATNLVIYKIEAPKYNREQLLTLAKNLGVTGEPERMPSSFSSAPGYWIKEANPTNRPWFKAVSFSEKSGSYVFAGDEDDHRWDLKNHRPLVRGVPTADEALAKTLQLLPMFNLTTNDLERTAEGKLRWRCTTDGTTYTDKTDGKKKRFIRRINVMLWQRMPGGGSTFSIGGGGMLEASYISDGKLAQVECVFRKLRPVGTAKLMNRNQIIQALKRGDARSFQMPSCQNLTITNCSLVYPQLSGDHKQSFVWPFYAASGFEIGDGETNYVAFYLLPPSD